MAVFFDNVNLLISEKFQNVNRHGDKEPVGQPTAIFPTQFDGARTTNCSANVSKTGYKYMAQPSTHVNKYIL